MTLDMIQQNSSSLVEVSGNFSRLERNREILLEQLESAKQAKNRRQASILSRKINKLEQELDEIRVFILKILTNLHKLVEEEQNGISGKTNIVKDK